MSEPEAYGPGLVEYAFLPVRTPFPASSDLVRSEEAVF